MIHVTCPCCKKVNPPFVIRPACSSCKYLFTIKLKDRQGFVVMDSAFSLQSTTVQDCFQMKGVCKNSDCCKHDIHTFVTVGKTNDCVGCIGCDL